MQLFIASILCFHPEALLFPSKDELISNEQTKSLCLNNAMHWLGDNPTKQSYCQLLVRRHSFRTTCREVVAVSVDD